MIRLQNAGTILETKSDRSSERLPAKAAKPAAAFSSVLSSETPGSSDFEKAFQSVIKNKRGVDRGKNPMSYGIMQSTLTDYDPKGRIARQVGDLTEDGARKIYSKIWERAGCGSLPSPLNAIHFDTYVQRPSAALELMKKSDGAPSVYLKMREKIPSLGVVTGNSLDVVVSDAKSTEAFLQQTAAASIVAARTPASGSQSAVCATGGKSADFESAVSFVIEQEGNRLVPNDNGAGASKFGILQKTLKSVDPKGRIASDISQLDEKKARAVYRKIWERTGCDKLPHPLNIVHFDSVVHSPRTANRALESAGGDPHAYLDSRLASLKALKSYQKYGKNWSERIDDLTRLIR